ncbi:MAG: hypothetical protein FWE15_15370 [Actinomycetia bacterium]|nr:hypothetical protein [Actinomycetes bacterium]
MSSRGRHPHLDTLAAAGFPVDELPEEQRQVLTTLTGAEIAVLIAVQERLAEAGPDVQAHAAEPIIGGVLF